MAEAIVDRLELVQIDEQDGQLAAISIGAGLGVDDAVVEQRPVGQARQRIMERTVHQLLFECLALGDVTTVEHDPLDVGVIEEIGRDRFQVATDAVGQLEAPLHWTGGPAGDQTIQESMRAGDLARR